MSLSDREIILDLRTQLNLSEAKNRELTRHIGRLIRENTIYHESELKLFQSLKECRALIHSDICNKTCIHECGNADKILKDFGHDSDIHKED